ncbi:MAG: hypothetical protein JXR86_16915 [Spirochaetales bacterium]|nr:hypothetical protein [Spirochaetales bacterium]
MISGSEEGYTFVEVLAALAILSLSGFLIWTGLSAGLAFLDKLAARNREISEIALFEYLLRTEAYKIGPAYWERDIPEDACGGVFEDDGRLFLKTDQGDIPFFTLHLIEIGNSRSEIRLKIKTDRDFELDINANYGKFPLIGNDDDS